jgi:hypothetical protein
MATYTELRQQFSNDTLRNRVAVACVIAANGALTGTPTLAQQKFANAVFSNPDSVGEKVLMSVLATNSANTVAQISAATDAQIQTAVNTVIPNLVAAMFG